MENAIQENNDRKNRRELLKEVLRRANKKEKQESECISGRQAAIAERMIDILKEWEKLIESDKRNDCPRNPQTLNQNDKRASEMSREEFNEWMRQYNKYFDDYFVWSSKSLAIMTEQTALVKESMELIMEFCTLETQEKWLLLSIALRSQPNLLKYIENSDKR